MNEEPNAPPEGAAGGLAENGAAGKAPQTPEDEISAAAEAPSQPAARPTPRPGDVYELDLTVDESLLDASGRIDWLKAMADAGMGSREAAPPAGRPEPPPPAPAEAPHPARPRSAARRGKAHPTPAPAPSQPVTQPPAAAAPLDWSQLPGAEKVLTRRAAAPPPRREEAPAPAAAPEAPPAEAKPEEGGEPLTRYERLKRTPSMSLSPEAVQIANEFAELMFHISRAQEKLAEFRAKYPYLIAPNVFGCWQDNLKECAATMLREFQLMKDGKRRTYEKKYVCLKCRSVFFVSLPDGICDECRGNMPKK